MKKIWLFAVLCIALCSCNDNKEQEKQLYKQVLALHDKVMAANGKLMKNKMQLDSLLKRGLLPAVKDSAILLNISLNSADDAMGDWMQQFEPDYSGKSHDAAMAYLSDQKIQITKIDSLTESAVALSGRFLSKHK